MILLKFYIITSFIASAITSILTFIQIYFTGFNTIVLVNKNTKIYQLIIAIISTIITGYILYDIR